MNLEDKLEKGVDLKEKGNVEYKSGHYSTALKCYHESLLYLKGSSSNVKIHRFLGLDSSSMDSFRPTTQSNHPYPEKATTAQKTLINETIRCVYNNMSACYLKQEKWDKVISASDKALLLNEKDAKPHYRKGQARLGLQDYEKAQQDLLKAAKLAPQDVGIRKELEKVREMQEQLMEKSRKEIKMNLQKHFQE